MMVDLLVHNVWIEGIEGLVDIAVDKGQILSIGSNPAVSSRMDVDGGGQLASPPFIDPHAHLDKAFLQPEPNISGTLDEAIRIMGNRKKELILPDLENRVDKALHWALSNGTQIIRTHVDIDSSVKLDTLIKMLEVKERWLGIVDLQIVAFPQEGLFRDPGARGFMRQAMQAGADIVGGIPAIEDNPKATRQHIDLVFDLAQNYNCDVDMHIDENLNPESRTLEMLADATISAGWQGRVCAGHCCALSVYEDDYAWRIIDKVRKAGIHVITNPGSNLAILGREGLKSTLRGITRVKELISAGVNVSCGHDNLRDSFYPFGQADMLEIAFLVALAAHMTGTQEIQDAFDMPRKNASKIIGSKSYGLRTGNSADFVLLPVKSVEDALASRPPRKYVFREGRLLYQSTTQESRNYLLPTKSDN